MVEITPIAPPRPSFSRLSFAALVPSGTRRDLLLVVSDQPPYVVSAAYQRPNRSKTVYRQLEAPIETKPDVDLSVYNLELNGQPLVIVLGNPPPPHVHEAIQRIMTTRQPVEVPATVLAALYQRSLSAWAHGPWRVHHHQPGKRYRVEE